MKTLQDMIKDLTGINVEQNKISKYLESEKLDLRGADLRCADLCYAKLQGADLRDADLKDIKITKEQLDQLTVIEGINNGKKKVLWRLSRRRIKYSLWWLLLVFFRWKI
ncbi:pentapeptide repeat-containing protein [Spiroplasma citri]|uniref:Pentapeptide repeat-containing protein n=1 Tax=Spiroplasma citri TaxID=2133 RepID=A0AAX3T0T0_SPICI|nr:pentapeptide repeat-containing protein [Spiroplasma citri]WFG97151.1 pentapeptide repeat-containing protein [Spiroplasma citri]